MPWVELFTVFVVCHLAGDSLAQTDWQARHKGGGFSADSVSRRALLSHVATYALCFVPAIVWTGSDRGILVALGAWAVVVIPHLIQDDGRMLDAYARRAKGLTAGPGGLMVALDQSFHVITLFFAALVIGL